MFKSSFLAPSPEPKISHSSPTAMVESIVEVMVLVEEMTRMILRGTLLMFGQGSYQSCRSNQTHNGRPWTSDDLHVIEPVVRWIATPGMRLVLFFV